MVEKPKKLTAEHIRKIKNTYRKKNIAKKHAKIMMQYWDDKKHMFNKPVYRKKLSKAKLGEKNPRSLNYKSSKKNVQV